MLKKSYVYVCVTLHICDAHLMIIFCSSLYQERATTITAEVEQVQTRVNTGDFQNRVYSEGLQHIR
jgi:hypothetical protein